MATQATFDEFSLLPENAEDAGLPWSGAPVVRRASADVNGRCVSAIVWGDAPADAAALPAGPPPTTMASHVMGAWGV